MTTKIGKLKNPYLKKVLKVCLLSQLTTFGLTGLAFLDGNVIKTGKFLLATNFELANSGQVRVETIVRYTISNHRQSISKLKRRISLFQ